MKRSTKYVFLDVHQATSFVTVREESGRVILRKVVATQAGELMDLFRAMRGTIHVGFEEGTQAQWLHDLLVPVVDQVVVCDRRGQAQQGIKSDRFDADLGAELLQRGALRPVYHGDTDRLTLRELARSYMNLVEDATRVMLRLKALFRARGIGVKGSRVYSAKERANWLAQLENRGVRVRAQALYSQLDLLSELRPKAKEALISEAKKDPSYAVLRGIPFLGPVRVALLLAVLQTPWRFRTKRQLWAYCGLAVVTRSSSDYEMLAGKPVRRRRPPITRGLNRNHNRAAKNVFKSAATAASSRPGPFQELYRQMIERGMREELARVTLTRKLSAVTLRLWKKGERFDPTQLTRQAH